MAIVTINPATGEALRSFEALSKAQINEKLTLAADASRLYRHTAFAERAKLMIRAAEILETEKKSFGRLMTTEMGKPLRAAIEEATKCAWGCRFYAENAAAFLADEVVPTNATRSFIRYQPLGPVLAIMPWNFPFWQVFRFAAPALMAGNVVLLKHASNVPQCALAIEDIFRRAGFPQGVFQTLLIGSDQVQSVLDDPRVVAATLTGSETAGIKVASAAGKLIKKTVLELGGSDPFIVMPSTDLDAAVNTAVKARTINNGQSCIAAKRFIVHEGIADAFEHQFVRAMQQLVVGDPMDERTQVGPLAGKQLLDDLDAQVRESVKLGARASTGGHRIERAGFYFEPTVLVNIPPSSPAYRDELFGPVASIFRARDIVEAIQIANDTRFGLGASAWTNDAREMKRFARELQAGTVFINGMVASDPRFPFGGVKASGYGRELSEVGIREFVNIKAVWVK
jgi:succinate-semialdehyde dehydrogenase / glutarate-semialdehyde dehydrogenase